MANLLPGIANHKPTAPTSRDSVESFSSYRPRSPIRPRSASIHELQEKALGGKQTVSITPQQPPVDSKGQNRNQPAVRTRAETFKSPRSVHDSDFFASHEAEVAKHTHRLIKPPDREPFLVSYKHPVKASNEAVNALGFSATSPVDFPKSLKAERYPARRDSQQEQDQNDEVILNSSERPKALKWAVRAVTSIKDLKASRTVASKELPPPPSSHVGGISETTVDTTVLNIITPSAEPKPLLPASHHNEEAQSTNGSSCYAAMVNAFRKFKSVRLGPSSSTGTLTSLSVLPEPQKPKEIVDEEYEDEKNNLYYALNMNRDNKDRIRRRIDRKRKEDLEKCLQLLTLLPRLLPGEPDSGKDRIDRLKAELVEIEKREHHKSEKLKLNKDLDADAQVAADGEDLCCRTRPTNAESLPGNAIARNRLHPNTSATSDISTAYAVTDIEFIESSGHIQLIGPPNYGGLATGTLWTDGAYHNHGSRPPAAAILNPVQGDAEVGCMCKNNQCYQAVSDDAYKYIGMARTRKEKRWVIHLSKTKPGEEWRQPIPRKPVLAALASQSSSQATTL